MVGMNEKNGWSSVCLKKEIQIYHEITLLHHEIKCIENVFKGTYQNMYRENKVYFTYQNTTSKMLGHHKVFPQDKYHPVFKSKYK